MSETQTTKNAAQIALAQEWVSRAEASRAAMTEEQRVAYAAQDAAIKAAADKAFDEAFNDDPQAPDDHREDALWAAAALWTHPRAGTEACEPLLWAQSLLREAESFAAREGARSYADEAYFKRLIEKTVFAAVETILRSGGEVLMNLTPHPVTIRHGAGQIGPELQETYLPVGPPVRLKMTDETVGKVHNVPLVEARFGEAVNLPKEVQGVTLIVSGMVVDAVPHRADLVAPHDLVRDAQGVIIGCQSLRRAPVVGP